MKAGFDVTRLCYLNDPLGTPSFAFLNLWDFMNDAPAIENGGFQATTGSPGGFRNDNRQDILGIFYQDNWKLRQNLTLNLGLRWSHFGPLTDKVQSQSLEPGPGLGFEVTQQLLQARRPFTAIFAFNDLTAIGAIFALREAALRVPKDISVVGFDDVLTATTNNPPLTTIHQPLRSMGQTAATTLLGIIRDAIPRPHHRPHHRLSRADGAQVHRPCCFTRRRRRELERASCVTKDPLFGAAPVRSPP